MIKRWGEVSPVKL